MNCDLDEYVEINQVKLYARNDMVVNSSVDGEFEPETFDYWIKNTKTGSSIDIGAYTGVYCISASKNGSNSIAIEPNPKVHSRLISNIKENDADVTVHNIGLSNMAGRQPFFMKDIPLTSGGSIGKTGNCFINTYIGDLYLNISNVTAIKIDVEGHECEVITGLSEMIAVDEPMMIVEYNNTRNFIDVSRLMKTYGYELCDMCDGRNAIYKKRQLLMG